jgi:glycine dehydrogenase subunit 2
MAGYDVVQIPCDERGLVDLEALKAAVDDTTSALMLTNPSTLGLFEEEIIAMAKAVHQAGGLLYYDGANMNAIMGYTRPGDMGFDVVHLIFTRRWPLRTVEAAPVAARSGLKKASPVSACSPG